MRRLLRCRAAHRLWTFKSDEAEPGARAESGCAESILTSRSSSLLLASPLIHLTIYPYIFGGAIFHEVFPQRRDQGLGRELLRLGPGGGQAGETRAGGRGRAGTSGTARTHPPASHQPTA